MRKLGIVALGAAAALTLAGVPSTEAAVPRSRRRATSASGSSAPTRPEEARDYLEDDLRGGEPRLDPHHRGAVVGPASSTG